MNNSMNTWQDKVASIGLLALRIGFGCFMLVHGIGKVTNFEAMSTAFPDPIGMGSKTSLILAIGAEVGCSLLLIVGLATRLAVIPLAATMIVALFLVHAADPWQKKELAAVFLTVYVALFFTGGGVFSLDHMLWSRGKSKLKKAE